MGKPNELKAEGTAKRGQPKGAEGTAEGKPRIIQKEKPKGTTEGAAEGIAEEGKGGHKGIPFPSIPFEPSGRK